MSLSFTPGKIVNLAAAASGALGTVLLFRGSFAYEAPAYYMNKKLMEDMRDRNSRRMVLQRNGLRLLMLSFTLAGIAQFLD